MWLYIPLNRPFRCNFRLKKGTACYSFFVFFFPFPRVTLLNSVLRKEKNKIEKLAPDWKKWNIFSVKGKCYIFKPLLRFVSFHCDNLVLFLVGNNYMAIAVIMPN